MTEGAAGLDKREGRWNLSRELNPGFSIPPSAKRGRAFGPLYMHALLENMFVHESRS